MALPSTPRDFSGFSVKSRGQAYDLKQMLAATASDGIVVLHDGRIVFEDYANGTTADTQHIIMSATKSMTGLVAGMLKARGLLDTEALVSDYVEEVTLTAYQGATIQQLLGKGPAAQPEAAAVVRRTLAWSKSKANAAIGPAPVAAIV